MTSAEAYEIAEAAVKRLAEERGPDAVFPFDAIWGYAAKEVPWQLKSGQAKRLERKGFVEPTGAFTKAETPDRAGSRTSEYRLGLKLLPEAPAISTSAHVKHNYADMLRSLTGAMEAEGFLVSAVQLTDFYLALRTSPLTILAGFSGTGKSVLPRLFARLTGSNFTPVSVQPQWSDNADLLGYTSTLQERVFVEGRLTKAIRTAAEAPGVLSLVLLDEMNLAPVEHYFSDYLSVSETRRRLSGNIATDALPLALPAVTSGEADAYAQLRNLGLSSSLRIVGTANMDETTRPFSPKVLDRAFTIEFESVDLAAFPSPTPGTAPNQPQTELAKRIIAPTEPITVGEALPRHAALFDWVASHLMQTGSILRPAGIELGYRSRDAICLYLAHWKDDELESIMTRDVAFDSCLMHKVLPKIAGTGEGLQKSLEEFVAWLELTDAAGERGAFTRSAEKARRMLARLEADGAVSFWSC